MVIRSARGPFDCFHFSNLTLEVVVYHELYHISRHAQLELAASCVAVGLSRLAARDRRSVGSDFSLQSTDRGTDARGARFRRASPGTYTSPTSQSPERYAVTYTEHTGHTRDRGHRATVSSPLSFVRPSARRRSGTDRIHS